MKKIKFTALFVVVFASLSITSCSNDDSEPSYGTSTGDYWPMAVGNQWTFEQEGVLVADPMKITGTDVFGGETYFRLTIPFTSGTGLGYDSQNWIIKKGAAYFQKTGDANFTQDGIAFNLKGYEVVALKDNLEVGGTWNGTASPKLTYTYNSQTGTLPIKISYKGTILGKGDTEIINGVTYDDVIKASIALEITINGQKTTGVSETWFANGVGPIKDSETIEGETTERILVDHILY